MPAPKVHDEQLLDRLTEVFQIHGYEGASLSLLSKATGLQRASLYHRFPGGKVEMAGVILARAWKWLSENALGLLEATGPPEHRVHQMTERLFEFYSSGRRSCLLDTLSLGAEDSPFRADVRSSMQRWISAMAAVAVDAGLGTEEAALRAEEALVQIEGALVVARGTDDPAVFRRALDRLPTLLTNHSQ